MLGCGTRLYNDSLSSSTSFCSLAPFLVTNVGGQTPPCHFPLTLLSTRHTKRHNYSSTGDGRPPRHATASAATRHLLALHKTRNGARQPLTKHTATMLLSPVAGRPLFPFVSALPTPRDRLREGHTEGPGQGLGHLHLYLRLHLLLRALCVVWFCDRFCTRR